MRLSEKTTQQIANALHFPSSVCLFLYLILWPQTSISGQCAWSLVNPWSEAEISVENEKPTPNPKLMRVRGNGKSSTLVSVVTPEKLAELNRILAHEPFAYHFPEDGCHARAHLMARKLEQLNIVSGKIFAWGSEWQSTLSIKVPYTLRQIFWKYHVSVLVVVKRGKEEYEPMIIDPSLSKDPLNTEEWLRKMSPASSTGAVFRGTRLKITNRFVLEPPGYPDFNHDQFFYRPPSDWKLSDIRKAYNIIQDNLKDLPNDRLEHWQNHLRAPAQIHKPLPRNFSSKPDWIRNEDNKVWVGFEDRVAFYFLSTDQNHFEENLEKLRNARGNREKIEIQFDPETLQILSVNRVD